MSERQRTPLWLLGWAVVGAALWTVLIVGAVLLWRALP